MKKYQLCDCCFELLTKFQKTLEIRSGWKIFCSEKCKRSWMSKKSYDDRKNKKEMLEISKLKRLENRKRALEIVGRGVLACSRCGCEKIEALQINHINCDGYLEKGRRGFVGKILSGQRKTDDLNILCVVCNIAHYAEDKFGIVHKIHFIGEENTTYRNKDSRCEIF